MKLRLIFWLAALLGPLLAAVVYALALPMRSAVLDWVVLALATGCGGGALWFATRSLRAKGLIVAAYVPIMAIGVALAIFATACATGNCL